MELPDSLVSNEVIKSAEVTTVGVGLSAVGVELPDSLVSNEVTEAAEVTTVGAGLSSVGVELAVPLVHWKAEKYLSNTSQLNV